jgi:hypothetical protein
MLPAIAALAERFAPVLGRYYAGILSSDATQQLAWYTVAEEELGKGQYRAPSWSWGATHNEVFRGG